MKHPYITLVMAVTAAFITSCGTQIQMTEAIPAKVNLRRGTTLVVSSSSGEMVRAFANKIAGDGYYKQPADGNVTALAYLNVRDIDVEKYQSGNSVGASLSATAEVRAGYQIAYRERYRVRIPVDSARHFYTDDACDSFAANVMSDLTPHERTYHVRVNGSSKNPQVDMAAKYAKAGDWNSAASNVLEAIKKDPNDPESWFMAGLVFRQIMDYPKSTLMFKKAYSLKKKGKYMNAIQKNRVLAINDESVKKQLSGE